MVTKTKTTELSAVGPRFVDLVGFAERLRESAASFQPVNEATKAKVMAA